MKKIIFVLEIITLIYLFSGKIIAQGISINITGALPDASAIFDVNSSNQGILIPRIALTDTADVTTIPAPATSLLVYNTSTSGGLVEGYYYNTGTSVSPHWVEIAPNPLNQDLNLAGNKIINLATCTDDHDAANKAYVDAAVLAGGGGGGGTGGGSPTGCEACITEQSYLLYGGAAVNFGNCADSCYNLVYNGQSDWRIPTLNEKLYARTSMAVPPGGRYTSWTWTCTADFHSNQGSSYALYVESTGEIGNTYSSGWGSFRCRCVR